MLLLASARLASRLAGLRSRPYSTRGFAAHGVLRRLTGMTLEAEGCEAPVGSRCIVVDAGGGTAETEVVGFSGGSLLLVATDEIGDLTPGARVIPGGKVFEARAGAGLLGRVLDGAGQPLDSLGPLHCEDRIRLTPRPLNPLDRKPIREPLDVGVRSINALLTVGRGQRLGLFAGSGVGKSVLLGMMTRFTTADVIVVGLIGERGREVQDFVSHYLTRETRKRAVIIATPADRPPLVRIHSALLATSIAEYFRDRGKNVLLLMDSLTRVSQAQREIALAIGEPPVTKGYPVSVFAKLPQLVERAGNGGPNGGSITAFYTVLTEGDDPNDPDRRRGACRARRPHRAVAADRRDGPVSRDRHRGVDQPAHADGHVAGAAAVDSPLSPAQCRVRAEPRPDHDRRLREGQRPARRRGDPALAGAPEISAAGRQRVDLVRPELHGVEGAVPRGTSA